MSLTEISFLQVVQKQYLFKLRSYTDLFLSLVAVQLIALLFTTAGMVGSSGIGWNNIAIKISFYSGTGIFIFSLFWMTVVSFVLTLPPYRHVDFSFVSNRLSSNLANLAYLLTATLVAALSTTLGSILVRNISYYFGEKKYLLSPNFGVSPTDFLTSLAVATLYLLLLSGIGYLAGSLIQLHRSLYTILPALLFAAFLFMASNSPHHLCKMVYFYTLENSPALFVLKILISLLLLWGGAVLLSNQTEVH